MATEEELIPCPGGCGNRLHRRALECHHCGYRGELTVIEDLLGSLSMVGSILTGFGLAALVGLAAGDPHAMEDTAMSLAAGCWSVSSILMLVVLVSAELLRRAEAGCDRMRVSAAEDERVWSRCERLLGTFTVALFGTLAGVVLVGFHFSPLHGIAGCVAAVIGVLIVGRTLR